MGRSRCWRGLAAPPASSGIRLVNCAGRTAPGWPAQTALLAAEGVGFKPNGCVDLARFLWDGVEKRI